MNQTVWKFSILKNGAFVENFSIEMPEKSEILYVELDANNTPCIWALVYPENNKEERFFELFGTGHEIPNNMGVERKYVGSYRYQHGDFIGHIFERL